MNTRVSPIDIVVLASGNGTNLQVIIDRIKSSRLSARLIAVISDQANAYALTRAKQDNIQAIFIDSKKFQNRADFDDALLQKLNDLDFDLIVLAGFMRILTADFVSHYENRIMNIHPSLLPRHKGLNTHQRVLDEGDKYHGATVHFVVPELDAGPIILQKKFSVSTSDTVEDLERRVHECEYEIYPQAIQMFAEGMLTS